MIRLLLVNDDPIFLYLLTELLQAKGYQVLCTSDAIFALGQIDDFQPNLIICDIRMEPIDGYQFIAELRQRPGGADLPVLVLTGMVQPRNREQTEALGAFYLSKPFNEEELLRLIERLTEGNT